jgi:hypothetical protein
VVEGDRDDVGGEWWRETEGEGRRR